MTMNKEDMLPRALAEMGHRQMTLANVDAEARTAELSFSSETEYTRFPGFVEVLSHEESAIDLTRLNGGANLLFNHDMDKVVGVVENARIGEDRKGRAVVRFGKSDFANQIWKDVQDGILRNVSVGYRINEMKLSRTRDDGADVYVANKWEPHEISIVSVPADHTVGIGRGLSDAQTNPPPPPPSIPQKITIMKDTTTPAADPLVAERERVRSILAIAKEFKNIEKAEDVAHEFASQGRSVDEFRSHLLGEVQKRNQKVVEASKPIGLSEREIQQFSFVKLLRSMSKPGDATLREQAAFEIEACEAAASKSDRSVRGIAIPVEVMHAPLYRGDVISIASGPGYTGTGGKTVATQLAPSFIEMLRKKTLAMQLATQLGGLVGNLDIVRQTAGTTGYWIGEDAAAQTEDVDFDLVSLRAKTVASKSEITRKMLMQSSIDVEAMVRADLAKGLAETIDAAFFYGAGTGAEPKGIKNQTGVNTFDWAAANAPTFAEIVRAETEIANDNASTDGAAYVLNTALKGYLKTTKKFATSGSDATLWEPGNSLNGYNALVSNQIAAGDLFYGDWSQAIVGLWGSLELTVDPFSHSDKGRLRIVAMQDVDTVVRHAESFCYIKNPSA